MCLVSPQAWERRQEFVCPLRNPAEAIDQAMALCSQGKAGDGPIVLPDMSDNPGERRIQLYTPGLRLAKFECLILIDFRIRLTCCFCRGRWDIRQHRNPAGDASAWREQLCDRHDCGPGGRGPLPFCWGGRPCSWYSRSRYRAPNLIAPSVYLSLIADGCGLQIDHECHSFCYSVVPNLSVVGC